MKWIALLILFMADPVSQFMNGLMGGALQPYMQSIDGAAIVASDETHAWRYTQNNENFPKCVLLYQGDSLRDGYPVAAINRIARVQFSCIVSRNRGLGVDRGTSLTQTVGNASPLFKNVGELRDIIRCYTYAGAIEMPVDYQDTTRPWQGIGFILDAYSINFSIPILLPAVSVENQVTSNANA